MTDYISLYVTVPTKEAAEKIARTLVEEHLAACVNIIAGVRSIYRWHGAVEAATELALIAKTRRALYGRAEKRVKELHSHEVPCIVAWPVESGLPAFLDWINEETKPQ